MEALIFSSRSINQDKLFQKRQDSRYEKHVRQLQLIQNERLNKFKDWNKEVKNMSSSLRKAKSAAKIFQQKEEFTTQKKENMSMFKRILYIEPSMKVNDKFQYVGSNTWNVHKKKLEEKLKVENRSIVQKLMSQQLEVKDYKKKLKEEIKDYIQRRNSIRKFKPLQDKSKRSFSEKLRAPSEANLKKKQTNIQSLQKQKMKKILGKMSPEAQEAKSPIKTQR